MAETITEMIVPGTYIEVRSEGLIGVSGISTGNIGIVGTAKKGPIGKAVILSSAAEGREVFGSYDEWDKTLKGHHTLTRAIELSFANGGSTVYAVRVSGRTAEGVATAAEASLMLNKGDAAVAKLVAKSPGTWGNDIAVEIASSDADGYIERRQYPYDANSFSPSIKGENNWILVKRADTGVESRLKLIVKDAMTGKPGAEEAWVHKSDGIIKLPDPALKVGDTILATYEVDKAACRSMKVTCGTRKEEFIIVDVADLALQANANSALVSVAAEAGKEYVVPDALAKKRLSNASDGESDPAIAAALEALENETVNIVLVAGESFKYFDKIASHLEITENIGKERIAIVGAESDDSDTVRANSQMFGSGRIVLVAPGVKATDTASNATVSLTPDYAAAAVAGLVSSLPVQGSLTNKTLAGVGGLSKAYSYGEMKNLISSRVLLLETRSGIRVSKGISTDDGAFKQVSVRRIVDYAKAGTRQACLPYIGKLNNERVRTALKTTLNGFLAEMVSNEALESYTLEVTASDDQRKQGICLVTMMLKPTFSIDYIKVIMNLS